MSERLESKDLQEQITNLDRILQVIREEENIDVLIETILNYLQTEFNYQLIWIGLYDRLDHRIFGKGGKTPDGEISFLKQKFTLNPGDLLEQVVIQLRPVKVRDLQEETRAGEWRKLAINYNIQGTTLFPIRYKDRCFGVVLLGSDAWGISSSSGEKAQLSIILGDLASTLYRIETDWQRQQAKRPDEPLLTLLSELRELTSADKRLQAVVEATHQFIQPSRTNVYWYHPLGRYFWCRATNRQFTPKWNDLNRPASGITVQDLGAFYDALAADRIVWIGESQSSLKTDLTGKLMQQIRVRSLLAAPIVFDNELLGFLAVEDNHPRIWQENEKNYLRGVGRLVALTSPLSSMEDKIRQAQGDRDLAAGVTRVIYSEDDWHKTLKIIAERLFKRFGAKYFLLLTKSASGQFKVVFQHLSAIGEIAIEFLPSLSEDDAKLLEENNEMVVIENWEEDKRLKAWREDLWQLGVRSLLGYNIRIAQSAIEVANAYSLTSKGVLVIGHETTRTWHRFEQELVQAVGQQLSLIMHQWQLDRFIYKQEQYIQYLQSGLSILELTPVEAAFSASSQMSNSSPSPPLVPEVKDQRDVSVLTTPQGKTQGHSIKQSIENLCLDRLQHNFVQFVAGAIAELTDADANAYPLVALVTWTPGAATGKLAALAAANSEFSLNDNLSIAVSSDELIARAIATDDWVRLKVNEIPAKSRGWLGVLDRGEIFVKALDTAPEHQPTGIFLIATAVGSLWQADQESTPDSLEDLLTTLVDRLAWSRRHLLVEANLESQRQELEWLNWYKQRRLEEFYRIVGVGVKQLSELNNFSGDTSGQQKDTTLTNLRYQQLLRQIANAVTSTTSLLKQEKWHLHTNYEIVIVANLLRRSLDRLEPLIKRRQIQLLARREGNWSIRADGIKLELVLYELLLTACFRSEPGGILEIRYQALDEKSLEISITDNGAIEPRLIAELKNGFLSDLLAPSPLITLPGKHLLVCQRIMQQMGGKLHIDLLENHRVVSQLILPLANG